MEKQVKVLRDYFFCRLLYSFFLRKMSSKVWWPRIFFFGGGDVISSLDKPGDMECFVVFLLLFSSRILFSCSCSAFCCTSCCKYLIRPEGGDGLDFDGGPVPFKINTANGTKFCKILNIFPFYIFIRVFRILNLNS